MAYFPWLKCDQFSTLLRLGKVQNKQISAHKPQFWLLSKSLPYYFVEGKRRGSTFFSVRLHQFFSNRRFGHIIHGANILLTIAQVSSKITLRDFSRGVLVYFCPPPRSCHCLAGPSVTLSIGSVHGVPSEWAGSQYACQCIDNVKFGVKCSMCICCAHYTRACEARPKADILYCLQLYCIVATLCCNILLALYCVNTIQCKTIQYNTIYCCTLVL